MAKINPKRDNPNLELVPGLTGDPERAKLMQEPMEDTTGFYKCVEYDDIDRAVLEFVDKEIPMDADGKLAPTFTLFSNQRFSEYSQTWQHTDKEGNLLMDFKTVNRDTDPDFGSYSEMHTIPGDRRYTLCYKEVMDENGTEHYEVHSVGQAIPVDLTYSVNYITSKMEKINDFNMKVNTLFKSLQCYINPNGHYMSMVLDGMSDESEYSIDNRKIFIQTAGFTVKGYIIPRDSYKIISIPKRIDEGIAMEQKNGKAHVYIDEVEETGENTITLEFRPDINKVEFTYDLEARAKCTLGEKENIRSVKVYVNGEWLTNTSNGFILRPDDEVKFEITKVEPGQPAGFVVHCIF